MFKVFLALLTTFGLLGLNAAVVFAAPFNAVNNPQIVANYDSGAHGVVGEPATHTGMDVVMRAGNSGNFQQWFYGNSSEDGLHGDHSVWLLQKNGGCPGNSTLIVNPNPSWGDYLVSGANYCVKTNDFHPGS